MAASSTHQEVVSLAPHPKTVGSSFPPRVHGATARLAKEDAKASLQTDPITVAAHEPHLTRSMSKFETSLEKASSRFSEGEEREEGASNILLKKPPISK